MNETLLGVLIGGGIAALPVMLTALLNYLDSRERRKHELRIRKFDNIDLIRINTLISYNEAIGNCMSVQSRKSNPEKAEEAYARYLAACERAYPYVSSETQTAMCACDPISGDLTDSNILRLNRLMTIELRNAIDQAVQPSNYSNKHQ